MLQPCLLGWMPTEWRRDPDSEMRSASRQGIEMALANRRIATAEVVYLRACEGLTNDPSDNRKAKRHRVLKSAIAAFNDRHCSLACVARDISETGVRLRTDSSVNIPDTFELVIELDGLEASCEVVWRRQNEIGARFLGAPRKCGPRRFQVIDAVAHARPSIRKR